MAYTRDAFCFRVYGEVNHLSGVIKGSQLLIDKYSFGLQHTIEQGAVDVFMRPWEISLAQQSDSFHQLPVKIIEAGPRGHFWQLTVQPLGWGQLPISVVWQSGANIPVRGEHYFLGTKQLRIYQDNNQVMLRELACSA